MSTLPTRTDISGTPSNATAKTALTSIYDFVAQRLAAGTGGAGAATNAELALARNSLQFTNMVGVAAGTTTDIGGVASVNVEITGASTTITSFGTTFTGGERSITTTNSQTIANNGNISTGFGSDVTTVAGESFRVVPNAAGTQWVIRGLNPAPILGTNTVGTAVPTVEFISEWLPNFKSYKLVVQWYRPATTSNALRARLRRNSVFVSTNGYSNSMRLSSTSPASADFNESLVSSLLVTEAVNTTLGNYSYSSSLEIFADSRVARDEVAATLLGSGTNQNQFHGSIAGGGILVNGSTLPITGIQLFAASGNIAQGRFVLTGYR